MSMIAAQTKLYTVILYMQFLLAFILKGGTASNGVHECSFERAPEVI